MGDEGESSPCSVVVGALLRGFFYAHVRNASLTWDSVHACRAEVGLLAPGLLCALSRPT